MKCKKSLMSLLVSLVLVSSLGLSGCKSSTTSDSGSTKQEGEVDKDSYLNVQMDADAKTLDPSIAADVYSSDINTNVQEALTRLTKDENGNPTIEPGIAEKWEVSEDGLTWTFHIRDAKWSDDKAITAKDFEYAVKRALDPRTGSPYAFLLAPVKGANAYNTPAWQAKAKEAGVDTSTVDTTTLKDEDLVPSISDDELGVKATDDHTLVFTLAQKCPYFEKLTYFKLMMPLRQDFVEAKGDNFCATKDDMLYSGPYIVQDWVRDSSYTLVKNDKYWDAENVKNTKVNIKIIKVNDTIMNALQAGDIDYATCSSKEWKDKLDQSGEYNTEVVPGSDYTYTFYNQAEKFNGEVNPFSNLKVRQAF
ncbi:MAG: peptide ABC transporter substrate-binding protein, partial [Clostridioides sp.]|nr:peptide ABC transporter substrate-binding protein [Clostridioides sp.]